MEDDDYAAKLDLGKKKKKKKDVRENRGKDMKKKSIIPSSIAGKRNEQKKPNGETVWTLNRGYSREGTESRDDKIIEIR